MFYFWCYHIPNTWHSVWDTIETYVGSCGTKEQKKTPQTGVALEVCHLIQCEVQRQDGTKGSFNDSAPTSGTWFFPSTLLPSQ